MGGKLSIRLVGVDDKWTLSPRGRGSNRSFKTLALTRTWVAKPSNRLPHHREAILRLAESQRQEGSCGTTLTAAIEECCHRGCGGIAERTELGLVFWPIQHDLEG